jgi:membrane protease YdiL (CAAX protease family)
VTAPLPPLEPEPTSAPEPLASAREPLGEGKPAWPAWYGFAALALSLFLAVFISGLLFAALSIGGGDIDTDDPGVTITATLIQDALLAGTALWLAAQTLRPRAWHFGLRRTRFWGGVKWAAIAFAIYFVFQLIYVNAVDPDQQQTTLEDLGAGSNAALTILIGILVVGLAPAIEEFFFRGFFYGALRTKYSFLPAAVVNGVVFGAIHAPTGVEAVPPLIVLGIAFCVAYEATGSILPCIGLHTLNNMIAFGVDEDGSWAVGGTVAAAVLISLVAIPARRRRVQTA